MFDRFALAAGLALAAVVTAPGSAAAAQEGDDAFEKARKRYEECLRRAPFLMHARGREALAECGDPRALEILAESYRKPGQPEEHARYLIAAVAGRHCVADEHVEVYDDWRERHDDAEDAWLWYHALKVRGQNRGPDALEELALGDGDVFLRGAAIEALAANRDKGLLDLIPLVYERLPKKAFGRAVLAGALGTALTRTDRRDKDTPRFRSAVVAYAHLLDEEHALSHSAKLVVARHLAKVLDVDELIIESAAWINLLADRANPTAGDEGYVRPRFFGVEATGERICYVIDMSDSMCKEINPAIKPEGPKTGPEKRKKRKKGGLPTEEDIPWHRVTTRFDLAREHLRISLGQLDPEQHFSVVFFGTQADLVEGCRGMVKASRSNVARVMKSLDAITPGSPTTMRPDGTLRGTTNLHGGLRRAFMVKKRGFVAEHAYVSPVAFEEGCDTIFLLSDGEPSWDDWDCMDTNYGEDRVGDPESHTPMDDAPRMHYSGPFARMHNLLEDLERMNLFREVEINCIGVGEVQLGFLRRMADIGQGKAVHMGG
ncbi:MAG: hypothetical protein QF903_12945 [Planctomycetota bacterium]|jgi:hypothetical protein|nr:hypothetical protein [Planctomycetota bacterium]MDP6764184.1 hypothetical protein [Planctomycetota bacterium]MDP6990370.1 hypothetical protein [Planctomycetota bacterium]